VSDSDPMTMIVAHLNRIEKKVDRLDERLDSSEKIQVRHTASLEEHMKRSDLLEANHELLRATTDPVVSAYTVAWGICKVILGISAIAVIAQAIYEIRK
jgi:hypothetical protein